MKPALSGITAAAIVLTLAACGNEAAPSAVTPSDSPSATDAAPAIGDDDEATEATASVPEESEAPEPEDEDIVEADAEEASADTEEHGADDSGDDGMATDPTDTFGESTLSDRGNLIKEVGQPAGVTNEDGEILVTFTLTEIVMDLECTSDWADDPENGHYLGLHFEIETTNLVAQEEYFYFDIHSFALKLLAPDGTRENDSVGNSYTCLGLDEEVPYDIGAGEKVSGWVVLDTALDEGTIIFDPYLDAAWEWTF